jgi:hypothetical protein
MFLRVINWITHPLLMLSIAVLILWKVDPFSFGTDADITIISILISSLLLPGIAITMLFVLKLAPTDRTLTKLDQVGPLLISGVFYLWMFRTIASHPQIGASVKQLVLGACISLFIGFFLNLFQKLSFHIVGLGFLSMAALFIHFQYGSNYIYFSSSHWAWGINTVFIPSLVLMVSVLYMYFYSIRYNTSWMSSLGPFIVGGFGLFLANMFYK